MFKTTYHPESIVIFYLHMSNDDYDNDNQHGDSGVINNFFLLCCHER